jgi:hypothetical protein
MRRLQIFVTEPQIKALKQQAKGAGLSVAELIRRAIDAVYPAQKASA